MNDGVCTLIDRFSKLILAIEDDEDFDPHWLCFYRIQMAYWILSCSGRCSDLDAAHRVYEHIRLSWKEISDYMNSGKFDIANPEGLFKTIDLDFTGQFDANSTVSKHTVSF